MAKLFQVMIVPNSVVIIGTNDESFVENIFRNGNG